MSQDAATSSGLKTSDGVISANPCRLKSIQVIADNTNAATAILYDNSSAASGTVIAKIVVDATTTYESFNSEGGIVCNNGLYLDLGGTGCEVIVHFCPS